MFLVSTLFCFTKLVEYFLRNSESVGGWGGETGETGHDWKARMQEEDEGNKEQWLGCSWSLEVGSFLMEHLGNISPPGSDW